MIRQLKIWNPLTPMGWIWIANAAVWVVVVWWLI